MAKILRYIAIETGSRAIANGFVAKLERRCERIASLPGTLGTARPELRPDIRSVTEQGYVIFFRYTGDRVEIVIILPGRMDIDVHFADPEPLQGH